MNPMQVMQGMLGGSPPTQCNTNAFELIINRLTATIDQYGIFTRVDDVMRKSNPLEGMQELITAQVRAQQGDSEEWKENNDDNVPKKEEAFEDKGRMHIIKGGSLTPIFSLFTVFTYVSPSDAAMKEELGWWTITVTIRDKRLIEKYGTEFKNYSGNIFNEAVFTTMLQEIEMILQYIIELDGIPVPENPDMLDLSTLPYGQQMTIRSVLGQPPS